MRKMTFDLESWRIKKIHLVIIYLSPLQADILTHSETKIQLDVKFY